MKRIAKVLTLQRFASNRVDAIRENLEVGEWLSARTTFQETSDVMPELVKRKSFCAAIGVTFGEKIYNPDRLSFELSLGGNYFPDLVIGDANNQDLVLVEFEGAERHQIYARQKSGEQYPDFSAKFQVGFFQLLDWVHRLKAQEQRRLESLAQSLMPGNNRLFIVTYDQLVVQVSARLNAL